MNIKYTIFENNYIFHEYKFKNWNDVIQFIKNNFDDTWNISISFFPSRDILKAQNMIIDIKQRDDLNRSMYSYSFKDVE